MGLIPRLDDLKEGYEVKILEQNSDKFTTGIIYTIISKISHPRGVLVKLKNDVKGRVQEIINTTISENETSFIVEPESTKIEYKQHYIYWNPENSSKNWNVNQHSIFKTITAFANGEGGKLIIGVHDDGRILGLEKDYAELQKLADERKAVGGSDRDRMELRITSDYKTFFREQEKFVHDLVKSIEFPKLKLDNGRTGEICIITVKASYDQPVVMYEEMWKTKHIPELYRLKKNGDRSNAKDFENYPKDKTLREEYYVRKGNSSKKYNAKEFIEFWNRRIKEKYRS